MSKQEIYVWSGFAQAAVLLIFYLFELTGAESFLFIETAETYSILWRILIAAVGIEFLIELYRSLNKDEINQDERDQLFKLKGYRNAYFTLVVIVFFLLGHFILNTYIFGLKDPSLVEKSNFFLFHVLAISILLASLVNSTTKIVLYRRGY